MPASMFNPRPRIQALPIDARHACYVIDDALVDPGYWVEYALAHRHAFEDSPHNAYPGPELRMPGAVSAQLDAFFATHVRGLLGARRTVRMYSRLSLATRAPQALQPRQWICHVDRLESVPGQRLAASVLYLFDDATLGGTGFFRPKQPMNVIAQLVQDSTTLDAAAFAARHNLRAEYMTRSNAYFEKMLVVPARRNRLIFYDGGLFHCGDITSPQRLSADPRVGRLTLNGFFVCTRSVAA